MYALEKIGLSIEILDKLSFESQLETSFKRTLSHFNKIEVKEDLIKNHFMVYPK